MAVFAQGIKCTFTLMYVFKSIFDSHILSLYVNDSWITKPVKDFSVFHVRLP